MPYNLSLVTSASRTPLGTQPVQTHTFTRTIQDMLSRIWHTALELLLPASARERALAACTPELLLKRLVVREQDGVLVLFKYRDPLVKELIWSLKYRGSTSAAALFAAALDDVLTEDMAEQQLFSPKPIALVPVPLSPRRQRARGYNQVEIVLTKLVQHMEDISYLPSALRKVRETKPQTELPKHERITNVLGAFSVPEPKAVAGRAVYLFDDVITTGATLREAAAVLECAGATVHPVALAH